MASDYPSNKLRFHVREGDYYGGDLRVLYEPAYEVAGQWIWDDGMDITWEAWGAHGSATITLQNVDEVVRLHRILSEALKLIDPDKWHQENPQ